MIRLDLSASFGIKPESRPLSFGSRSHSHWMRRGYGSRSVVVKPDFTASVRAQASLHQGTQTRLLGISDLFAFQYIRRRRVRLILLRGPVVGDDRPSVRRFSEPDDQVGEILYESTGPISCTKCRASTSSTCSLSHTDRPLGEEKACAARSVHNHDAMVRPSARHSMSNRVALVLVHCLAGSRRRSARPAIVELGKWRTGERN